ncbi:MAG: ribose 5-phosphate isomerase B [Acidobacteriota bacterium]
MRILFASDHAGFQTKEKLMEDVKKLGYGVSDFGTSSEESVDYVDFGLQAAEAVSSGKFDRGVLICGSGIGMSITANKVKGIRAALACTPEMARLSREHNDANILCMGSRINDYENILDMTRIWLETDFSGGRHLQRVEKIRALEDRLFK